MPPVYLFVIDVSAAAFACGMVSVVASTIKACLDQLPGDERTLVGFITYDAHLHFYNLKANLAAPQVRGGSRLWVLLGRGCVGLAGWLGAFVDVFAQLGAVSSSHPSAQDCLPYVSVTSSPHSPAPVPTAAPAARPCSYWPCRCCRCWW
jgi:hypothetical protein